MIKIPKVICQSNGARVCLGCTEFGQYAPDTDEVIYKAVNTDFDVTLNGIPCEVKECRVSAFPFNRPWPGKQRPYHQSESAGFIAFSADETVEIRVKRKKAFNAAQIRPLSKGVKAEVHDNEVVFVLHNHGAYVLEFGDIHNALHIFFDPIKDYPEAENATLYFGPGMHFPGVIHLRDNDTVYIDREAIVFGSLFSKGAKNVKIFGGGILDNSCEERLTENCYEDFTKGTFRIYHCENITISDIILTNSSTWALSMFHCSHVTVDNVKIVGHWRYNTDGIDVVNSDHVSIKNCFIRSFDDTISIKAIYNYQKPIEEIRVDNCVLWCGWGKTCEIGIETAGVEYRNITFKNCDVIHYAGGVMTISNGNYADMHHISFEDIRVELQEETLPQVLQTTEAQVYQDTGERGNPILISNSNTPYPIRFGKADGPIRNFSDRLGNIHDITYQKIAILTEGTVPKPIIRIKSEDQNLIFRNFQFEDIYMNGKRLSDFDAFETDFVNTKDVTIQ